MLMIRFKVNLGAHHYSRIIVNRGEWLWRPEHIKPSKQRCQDLCWKVHTVHNLFFCLHTLCMNYVTKTFLLVSSSVSGKQLLCFVQGQGQKWEQKHTTKNFVEYHNDSLLLTMAKWTLLATQSAHRRLFKSNQFSQFNLENHWQRLFHHLLWIQSWHCSCWTCRP